MLRMPLVEVLVNGRDYQVACDNGQEDRLRELAQLFDKRVQILASSVGQVGDARLLLMAGLVLTDELSNANAKCAEREKEIAFLKSKLAGSAETLEKAETGITELLEQASSRMEGIAARAAAS
jgi:cell division protein ZapA